MQYCHPSTPMPGKKRKSNMLGVIHKPFSEPISTYGLLRLSYLISVLVNIQIVWNAQQVTSRNHPGSACHKLSFLTWQGHLARAEGHSICGFPNKQDTNVRRIKKKPPWGRLLCPRAEGAGGSGIAPISVSPSRPDVCLPTEGASASRDRRARCPPPGETRDTPANPRGPLWPRWHRIRWH